MTGKKSLEKYHSDLVKVHAKNVISIHSHFHWIVRKINKIERSLYRIEKQLEIQNERKSLKDDGVK